MPLGIGELADLDVGSWHRLGAVDSFAAEAFGLRERDFEVGYLDVEGHVTRVVGCWGRCDAAADAAEVLGSGVGHTGDAPIVERVVGIDLPVKELRVVALQTRTVLTDDLEMNDRLSHLVLPSADGPQLAGFVLCSVLVDLMCDEQDRLDRGPRREIRS